MPTILGGVEIMAVYESDGHHDGYFEVAVETHLNLAAQRCIEGMLHISGMDFVSVHPSKPGSLLRVGVTRDAKGAPFSESEVLRIAKAFAEELREWAECLSDDEIAKFTEPINIAAAGAVHSDVNTDY